MTHSYPTNGLSGEEVLKRQQEGLVNRVSSSVSKPLSRIVLDNTCTLFNAVNALIAIALILVGSYHNLLFFGVVLCNTAIGIVQELRSKQTLEKLSLLHSTKTRVRRDGRDLFVAPEELVKDDRLLLSNGNQIAVDAVVQSGLLEVDESLLTGESVPIRKEAGDELLSGSFVVSGNGEAVAVRVGDNAYAARLIAQAKAYKRHRSRLLNDVNRIIRFTGYFMIPFAALLMIREWFSTDFVLKDAVTATAAALIGMMPQGLILLTTVALAVGVIRLAKKQTLVQELYGIESLSRVSLLCLDKTGTITTGHMSVCEVIPLSDHYDEALIGEAIHAIGDTNATAKALCRYFPAHHNYTVTERVPFSSDRKQSAVCFRKIGSVLFGAFDRLFPDTPLPASVQSHIASGKRLLAVGLRRAENELQALAVIVLEDELRSNAGKILSYFTEEDVTVRVLSGDHPDTVAAVAAQAGLQNADRAVDASTLTSSEALRDAAARYIVFGRVTPVQKQELIRCFQEQGHTVAMVGDGVNDVSALKAADCSVAMAAGSDAARQVSQLVLLDSDFAALPATLMEGRRVVNNITRTASLFLVKTVMSFFITLCAILLPMTYPFEPLQLTLIGVFAESVPGFFLTLEPSCERIKGKFLHTVLKSAVPSAVIITLLIMLTQWLVAPLLSLSAEQTSTLCVWLTGFAWLLQLRRVCRPFTVARRILWVLMTVGFFTSALLLAGTLPAVFAALGFATETVFVLPTTAMWIAFGILSAVTIPLDYALCRVADTLIR